MQETIETASENNQPVTMPEKRAISGFWRRILALWIDSAILGLVGMLLGSIMFDFFVQIGAWGRLVGFCLALPYFSLLNSAVGKGQTIGKRIMKIEVVDRLGEHISINHSFVRYVILSLPFFLNGLLIPSSVVMSSLGFIIGFIVFSFIGAIIYLYIFNRRTRQSLHDLLVGTYVVKTVPHGPVGTEPIWKPHLVITGSWFAIVLVLLLAMPWIAQKGVFPGLLALQKKIESSGHVYTAAVSEGKNFTPTDSTKPNTSFLTIVAHWRTKPANYESAAKVIAAMAIENYQDIMTKDALVVVVSYGYDIGIAYATRNQTFKYTPEQWRNALQETQAK